MTYKFSHIGACYDKETESYGVMHNGRGYIMDKEDWVKLRDKMDKFYEQTNVEEHNKEIDEDVRREMESYNNTPTQKKVIKPKHIYFIQNEDGLTKIGISVNVKKRLSGLQTSNPSKLSLYYSVLSTRPEVHESQLHKRFNNFRVSGEWFDIPKGKLEEVKEEIEGLIENGRI